MPNLKQIGLRYSNTVYRCQDIIAKLMCYFLTSFGDTPSSPFVEESSMSVTSSNDSWWKALHATSTSCFGFMLYIILSAFSLSPLLSIIANNNLLALFFNSSTKSILVFPKGLISFNINAVIMSNPLDSWVAMQFWLSWHGPWQYSVNVSRVWLISDTLYSLIYSPRRPNPPVVEPQMQSRNMSVSDTKLKFVLLFWFRRKFYKAKTIINKFAWKKKYIYSIINRAIKFDHNNTCNSLLWFSQSNCRKRRIGCITKTLELNCPSSFSVPDVLPLFCLSNFSPNSSPEALFASSQGARPFRIFAYACPLDAVAWLNSSRNSSVIKIPLGFPAKLYDYLVDLYVNTQDSNQIKEKGKKKKEARDILKLLLTTICCISYLTHVFATVCPSLYYLYLPHALLLPCQMYLLSR